MDESTFTYIHPDLGSLTGLVRRPDVIQFRNVPYARIPARFRQSTLVDRLIDTERDCTGNGYASPQIPQTYLAFGGRLPGEPDREYDEFRCLNLIISTPEGALRNGEKRLLPVMVYVHGGAFSEGVHLGAFYDTSRMANLAVKENKDVVIVSIHYRLNWQGFIACQDILDEAELNKEPPCNFGFHDQRNGFLWVKKYISGFGGNPENITAFGESAGSVSLSLHMCSTVPLFKRAILQSGTPATNAPVADLSVKEMDYRRLLQYCGIDTEDPGRLAKLRVVPIEKLVAAISALKTVNFGPWADPGVFPQSPSYNNQTGLINDCWWVKEIIIGDASFEGFNFSQGLRQVPLETFIAHLRKFLGTENTQNLLEAYCISPEMDTNLAWKKLMLFGGDMVFSQPIHMMALSLARNSQKKLYRYNIALRNPFPGSIYTEIPGHHFIDLLFLFMTLSERYPTDRHRSISREFARRWISFANGLPPWKAYTIEEQAIALVDSQRGWTVQVREEDERLSKNNVEGGRRYSEWEAVHSILSKYGARASQIHEQLKAKSLIALADQG